ncbi:MAG: glycosyltransferase family 4 protein [Coriobacteriia bacterium]|nr:glycosyltransferase family 4 protein [Coriobacteriia bacterium]
MKVLVIPSWYPGPRDGNAGVFIRQQVRALTHVADVAVLFVEQGAGGFEPLVAEEDGATVVRVGVDGSGLRARYFGYRSAGRAGFAALEKAWGTPDVVHVQALWPAALIARDIKREHGIPFVVTEHSEEYAAASQRRLVRTPGMLPLILRPLAREAADYIAVSRTLAGRLEQLGLCDRAQVIPNVVPEFGPYQRPSAATQTIAHISSMGPAKRVDLLVEAAELLRVTRDDFVLRLIGDGEGRAGLEAMVRERGLGRFVRFDGLVSEAEVAAVLDECSFSAISSAHETFSVVAAESLMAGRPVVSTRCGGPEEFVTPEVGRLVDGDDAASLAAALGWMLDHASEFAPQMLHDYAAERFAPGVVAQRLVEVYRGVLGA